MNNRSYSHLSIYMLYRRWPLFPIIHNIRPHLSQLQSHIVGHSHTAIHKHSVHNSMCSHNFLSSLEVALKEKYPDESSQASLCESLQDGEEGESSPGQGIDDV